MKKALLKNTLSEIKHSGSRFLSIFGIVAIGVAFFSGVKAASPDMKLSGDTYFDENKLMDFRVVSTYGLNGDDIKALESVGGARVTPSYYCDMMMNAEDGDKVVRAIALDNDSENSDVNRCIITEGRAPTAENECIIDSGFIKGAELGSVIKLYCDGESPLKTTEYTVTGTFNSPMYIDKSGLGTATIGNGKISAILYVPASNFTSEVYTQAYLSFGELEKMGCYSEEYENRAEELAGAIEKIGEVRSAARLSEIKADGEAEIADGKKELSEQREKADKELLEAKQKLDDGKKTLDENAAKIADGEKEIEEAEERLKNARTELDGGYAEYESGKAELSEKTAAARQEIAEKQAELQSGEKAYAEGLSEYEANEQKLLDGKTQLDEGKIKLNALTEKYGAENILVAAAQKKYDEGKAEYDAGAEKLAAAKQTLDETRKTLDEGKAALDAGIKQLDEQEESGKAELSAAYQKLLDGEKEYSDGTAAAEKAKADLSDGKKQYEDGLKEWQSGLSEYEKASAEAEQKLSEAETEIADAEKKLSELSEPVWYVFDRTSNTGYSEYSQNADRIDNISKVFPVFFLLVAGLVCLTTMTRMVEEQRTQIGTLKALGYKNGSIMFKFMFYALTATVLGAVVGFLVGMKVFPFVIMTAYGMLYTMSAVELPYHLSLALISTIASVLAVTLTVYFSCRMELKENPAQLMRPKPPRLGKRVLLEKIGFIWKRLKFTQKVAVRNIFRYKRRMLMTVIGIAGCTALTLTGFALRDSINDIVAKQYGEIIKYDGIAAINADSSDEELQSAERVFAESGSKYLRVYQHMVTVKANGKSVDGYVIVPENAEGFGDYVTLKTRGKDLSFSLTDGGIIADEKSGYLLGNLSEGKSLTVQLSETEKAEATVMRYTENYPMHYYYMTAKTYADLFGAAPDYNMYYYINGESGETGEMLTENLLKCDGIMAVSENETSMTTFDAMLKALDMVIIVIIGAAGLLAFVVLYNLTNINITERVREISTLKVLGFYDLEVDRYVFRENIILTLMGTAVGLVVGYFLASFIVTTAEVDIVMFGRDIYPLSYAIAAAITLAFSLIVSLFVHGRLIKINMVEALKSVE